MKTVLVTNIPYPYRVPVYDRIANLLGNDFVVLYSSATEPNRQWKIPSLHHAHRFLKKLYVRYSIEGFYHINFDVLKHLAELNPDVVILYGYGPTQQLAFLWCWLRKKRIVLFNEGWAITEQSLSERQRALKKFIVGKAHAFIGASKKAAQLYGQYGAPQARIFVSPMAIANERFVPPPSVEKQFDVLFSGQFIDRKKPFFFADVVQNLARTRPLHVLLLGDGPLRSTILQRLSEAGVRYTAPGFVQEDELPSFFHRSKILLFPTMEDTWGIVSNEAFASGIPVITTGNAGTAHDLVVHGETGFVLDLNVDDWAKHASMLLEDEHLYAKLSNKALERVQAYNFDVAAQAIIRACEKSLS